MHEAGGLLERLEQPVGDLVVHRVHPLEHEHAPGGLEWRRVRPPPPVGHVLGAHHVRTRGSHPRQVGVRSGLDTPTHAVGIGVALGEELGGESPGRRSLAYPGGSVEQIGV